MEEQRKDECKCFMEAYVKCVQENNKGLSAQTGECLDEKELYRECMKKRKNA